MIILCGVMGITLFLFFAYHLTMIKNGFTTNEKIKRSDLISFLSKEIEKFNKNPIVITENMEEKERKAKQELINKAEIYKKDLATLRNFRSEGFLHNLKEILKA
jgi:hypothetical protein